ncbi:MAG: UTP--glucose-1-phosphate uridylyltransferase GalU [Caulobacterales bacterium]
MTRVRKAVLPVAGFGTRVLPATKSIPKEMLTVVDRPAIQYVVDEALAAGIEHIVFITGRNKGAIEDYFDQAYELESTLREKGKLELLGQLQSKTPKAGTTSFIRQQEPKGLGHAIWCARDVIGNEPFAILLPDMLMMAQPSCLRQMVDAYDKVGGNIIAVEPCDDPSGYGVIDPAGRDGPLIRMKGMVEKPKAGTAPSNLFIAGRYILQPEIFELLANQEKGAGGEIQLTDSMARLMQDQSFHALEYDGKSYDCGDKVGYLRAVVTYALANGEIGDAARAVLKEALAK